jgi:hypothetical protein
MGGSTHGGLRRFLRRRQNLHLQATTNRRRNAAQLCNTPEQACRLMARDPFAYPFLKGDVRNNRAVVLAAVTVRGSVLEFMLPWWASDREVVLAAVASCGGALLFASRDLCDDLEVVLAAVTEDGLSLEYASDRLRGDLAVVSAAVERCGCALKYATPDLRRNRKVVLRALSCDGTVFEYVAPELRIDREIVIAAVTEAGVLDLVPDVLRKDREVVLAAVTRDGLSLQFAARELRRDRAIVMAAIASNYWSVQYAAPGMITTDLALAAITTNPFALKALAQAFPHLADEREIVLAAVTKNGQVLAHASPRLRADPDIQRAANAGRRVQ